MNWLTSSTARATTAIVSVVPLASTFGRTAVIRTSSGKVVSKRLNSSVHENVRRSIRSLALRASSETNSICLGSTLARSRAASARRSAALASSRDACVPRRVSLRDNWMTRVTLKTLASTTIRSSSRMASRTARSL